MKRENTIEQNVEFLLMMYKRELDLIKSGKEDAPIEIEEAYECIVIELETILEYNK